MVNPMDLALTYNQFRMSRGWDDAVEDPRLSKAAQALAEYIAKTGVVSHVSDLEDFRQRLLAVGLVNLLATENAGVAETALDVLQAWQDSPQHLKNMTNPLLTSMGIGHQLLSDGTQRTVWVLTLGKV